jgi:phage major head subunit gpT-like protein
MTRRSIAAGVSRRAVSASSYDAEARTVEMRLVTETPILMPGWKIGIEARAYYEILDCSPSAVDLSMVAPGNCPLLDSHGRYELADMLGIVNSARLENRELIIVAGFGQSDAARSLEAEVAAQTAPPASAGYAIQELLLERFEGDIPVYRAVRWKLTEASFVPIAADPNAGVRSDHGLHPCIIQETRAMSQSNNAGNPVTDREQLLAAIADEGTRAAVAALLPPVVTQAQTREQLLASVSDVATRAAIAALLPAPVQAAPAAPTVINPADGARERGAVVLTAGDVLELQDQARAMGVETQVRDLLGAPNSTRAQISDAILAAAVARQSGTGGSRLAAGAGARVGDERESTHDGIRGAILHNLRRTTKVDDVPEVSRQYMRNSLAELAAVSLGEREMPRSAADRVEVFERAFHTTSDFPLLLSGALNTRLEDNYQVAAPVYREIASEMTFSDFRPHTVLRSGDFPQLLPVGEAGEIKFGTFGEKQETVAVGAYGIQFGLSRQLMVNDNLGAIDQVLRNQGMAVALFEEITFFAMKNVAAGLGPVLNDGATVFHAATHGNYDAGGTAITTAALGAGRAKLRKMKNMGGQQMGLAPAILLVSPDKETEAEMALAQVVINDVAKANPFAGKLRLVVGGQLTGNAWELYTAPAFGTNWTWGLLDGFKAPRLKVQDVFGQQGAKISLEHDFGCGATEFRFGYRNAGA